MKVTVFFVIIFVITLISCRQFYSLDDQLAFQQKVDSIASWKIDSAYATINRQCDSLLKYKIPEIVDSLLKVDSFAGKNDALPK